jgi:DNA-binding sugar fermentation-stimulating protein
MLSEVLYEIPLLHKARIINRPSKKVKSPYLADIQLFENDNEELAHSPALGCCGLIDKEKIVYVLENQGDENSKRKSKYTIYNVEIDDPKIIIGVNPNIANSIFEQILKKNILPELSGATNIKREVTILDSRIDFSFTLDNKTIYAEVKNVPLADYVDVEKKERKNYDTSNYNKYEKIAIFPDGYRKNAKDLISPRAYKHVNDLITIQHMENHQSYLIYIIQREDCIYFKPSILDEIYQEKVYESIYHGVKILPISVIWKDNKVYFNKILELVI